MSHARVMDLCSVYAYRRFPYEGVILPVDACLPYFQYQDHTEFVSTTVHPKPHETMTSVLSRSMRIYGLFPSGR
jgi:hypothetical protein